jgi:hypothetical protein
MTKSTAQIMLETANTFVANCDSETIAWVTQHSPAKLAVPAIDADEALYENTEFDPNRELFVGNNDMDEQLWDVYCKALDSQFLIQHKIVTNFY